MREEPGDGGETGVGVGSAGVDGRREPVDHQKGINVELQRMQGTSDGETSLILQSHLHSTLHRAGRGRHQGMFRGKRRAHANP